MNTLKNLFSHKTYYYFDQDNNIQDRPLNFLQIFFRNHCCFGFYKETHSSNLTNKVDLLVQNRQFPDTKEKMERLLQVTKVAAKRPFTHMKNSLFSSRDCMLAALNFGIPVFADAEPSLKNDKNFLWQALEIPTIELAQVFDFMNPNFKKDSSFIVEAMRRKDVDAILPFVDSELR